MGSALQLSLGAAGVFSVALGAVHFAIPALMRYPIALGTEATHGDLGMLTVGPVRYALRRQDLVGVAWVMSNAASLVLITAGGVDLAWAAKAAIVPVTPVAWWLAAWWGLRAASQLALGRRALDIALLCLFGSLAGLHVIAGLSL